ncbi:Qat anti-phage system QueC-like protein QatC [Alicyclobacillus dauci]|uniref:7-cyano-7-deazaguanine synthase (Queuosine biosynthesis) n=1 Tax=Alicyclobacillus dauci TaxID=1475485 RepID=A0ABY6Z353_9BACL|nr:Qat anti-phage system QueC-like protein QatC [Alicyclobacillus dauci]WAH37048.1 hypothetical protein NZD86_00240 [Alicyclobacillus dauci]
MIEVTIIPGENTKFDFAKVRLNNTHTGAFCALDLDFKTLYQKCGIPNQTVLDFLFIAAVFYATDKFIKRNDSKDNWTRDIKIRIPVYELDKWNDSKAYLEECMSFLTGDVWDIEFYLNQYTLHRPRPTAQDLSVPRVQADSVCLFSGGLDSFVGAIDWLETHQDKGILLVGHYDGHVKGPMSDQTKLLQHLRRPETQERIESLQVRVGQHPAGKERTFRSRSILFLALGVYAAASIRPDVPLIIPENGTIAINIPLTPSRRGTCSTRTTHPRYIRMVQRLLHNIGVLNPIINPLGFKTKGEVVVQCQNQVLLRQGIPDSVSCGKSGHKSSWVRRYAKGCGRCVPCIFRRASLHMIGADTECYGTDVLSDELDLRGNKDSANDFRAVIAFLGHNYDLESVKLLLMASSSQLDDLDAYAGIVFRAMEEVRRLIRDKGTTEIKRLAGIV